MKNQSSIMLELKDIEIRLKTKTTPLFSKLSLSLKQGEILGIIGSSGSGKSTLINAIMHALPSGFELSGKINITPGTRLALAAQSRNALNPTTKIGRQLSQFIPKKSWFTRNNKEKVHNALAHAQLPYSVAELYPHQLSGGMAKRVLSALAFIQQPDILIADEPSCGINDEYSAPLFQHYQHLAHKDGKTVIIVSHDLSHIIDIADHILVLKNNNNDENTASIEHTTPSHIINGESDAYSQALWHALPKNWN
ncbi:ATP-binding cassette domain-containing protein [Aliivibrio fischeri]|uniref:ATP-binding cassette domain-containing protein n=1 Tax=Aliivibrio fischeri TaxID=668 RepID=UPI0012D9889E|nr:ATP-binding cassette domain-containing protein [Aliivibrio fischeri]MUK63788.1 ATP-binding cassette domain-containing protein [Aliivibrio fischeri]MUL19540.1 ATP-binding cassette domain-containing protein [Aliivibrio fischeri]MUL24878.1 ATP-binding cassette domain-containing protein [Aliivibrio fischeri]